MNYYNEFDHKAAAWLRELIRAGLIPDGHVDTRSIVDVQPSDLTGYAQCHFFAGIGGWSLALQLAGWPTDRPVWTGSCPCQPFSSAGKQLGAADERHLWPAFFNLIRQCRPESVLGEQVANAIGKGWLDGVSADLEQEGYACGAAVLGAHSVGAPHIRQRLYWMANAGMQQPQGRGRSVDLQRTTTRQAEFCVFSGGLADPIVQRGCGRDCEGEYADHALASGHVDWNRSQWIDCRDGKKRRVPVEPGFQPLAHGVPGRVGLLRGYGNAIVPQVAAAFIEAARVNP